MATQWLASSFPGVRYYKHQTRKHGVRFDQYFAIRFKLDGKSIEQGLGWASEGMTAQKAYEIRNELKESGRTATGATTLKERRRAKALNEQANPTLTEAIEAFLIYCERSLRPKTIRGYKDGLAKAQEYTPAKGTGKLGTWKFQEIQRRHIASLIDKIAADSPSVAIQVRSSLSALYAWAMQSPREYIETNIVRDTPRPQKPKPRERYLTGSEAGKLWQALNHAEGSANMIRCLKFALLVGCRISEASGMHAQEIDGNWWTIPSGRFKGKRAHRVYLTNTAKELIGQQNEGLIFPSERTGKAFETSSFGFWLKTNNHFGMPKFSCHDFRRTVASGLAELKFSQDVVAAVLGHKLQGVTAEHYIRHKYDKEKESALTSWQRYLLSFANPKENKNTNVINLFK